MKKLMFLLMITLLLFLSGCMESRKPFYRLDLGDSFNTISELQITDPDKTLSTSKVLRIQKESKKILVDLDKKFNVQTRDGFEYLTELKKVNNGAGIESIKVSTEVYDLVKYSYGFSNLENAEDIFDITVGPLVALWDFNNKKYLESNPIKYDIPSESQINAALLKTGKTRVEFSDLEESIYLNTPGMILDLGAVVKGYAAEKIRAYLITEGLSSAVISVGRNIVLLGLNGDAEWSVKFQTPFIHIGQAGYYFGTLKSADKALVTSGVYEKYLMGTDDKLYHHILDPKTGYPFDNGLLAVSVVTSNSTYADIMSTLVFGLGLSAGYSLVEETSDLEAIFIYDNLGIKEIYLTSGLKDKFTFNEEASDLNYIYKGMIDYE